MYSCFLNVPPPPTPTPAGGQTKGSSSVIVPEARALSIDLLSPNFSVTYALLNSHYCSHWSLIRGNNGLVVTEGENMSRPLTAWAQTHDFSSRSPPGDLRAPRAGPWIPTPNLNPLQMNQKIGSPSFHQPAPPLKKKNTAFRASRHQTVAVIRLKQRRRSLPECPRRSSSTHSLLSLPFNYMFLCS